MMSVFKSLLVLHDELFLKISSIYSCTSCKVIVIGRDMNQLYIWPIISMQNFNAKFNLNLSIIFGGEKYISWSNYRHYPPPVKCSVILLMQSTHKLFSVDTFSTRQDLNRDIPVGTAVHTQFEKYFKDFEFNKSFFFLFSKTSLSWLIFWRRIICHLLYLWTVQTSISKNRI